MSLLKQLVATGGVSTPPTYVDDVFSSYPYTGTGATQSIVNGIDLSTKGGLTWIKQRSGTQDHVLFDTVRGVNKYVRTQSTGTEQSVLTDLVTAFNTNGFSIGTDASTAGIVNASGSTYSSWSFREAAKFFDVVTYTGDGTTSKTIAHNLGQQVGMIAIKRLDGIGAWTIYHTSLGNTTGLAFTTAANFTSAIVWNSTSPTTTGFTVGDNTLNNISSATYVAYVFAHNSATDGLIQCGSYTGTGAAGVNVTLGWEPQAVLVKRATGGSGSWYMMDSARGMSVIDDKYLLAESLSSESNFGGAALSPTATGFRIDSSGTGLNASGATYIYMAIRKSNKPPTSGTQVYNPNNVTGNSSTSRKLTLTSFPPDFLLVMARDGTTISMISDKLRGATKSLAPASTGTEASWSGTNQVISFNQDGVTVGDHISFNETARTFSYHSIKRATGVFDIVNYVGVAGSSQQIPHGLGVKPELMIVKCMNFAGYSWAVYAQPMGATQGCQLNNTGGFFTNGLYWDNTEPTSSVFTIGSGDDTKPSAGASMIAYLFASLAGVSKVGSYTGNGTSLNIDCGFAAGARFILIKRTDAAGDWYIWDSARGIVAGNDPHLSINATAAEVTTDDSIDPLAAGFIVNQVAATNINVNAANYIYLAFS